MIGLLLLIFRFKELGSLEAFLAKLIRQSSRGNPPCLNIFFMKYLDPEELVLVSFIASLKRGTALVLDEMAKDLGISIDELLSAIAEDAVTGLMREREVLQDVFIPDSCSTEDLIRILGK